MNSKEVWEGLTSSEKKKLKNYYRSVLEYGFRPLMKEVKKKQHTRLLNWTVRNSLTIHDIPLKDCQDIQLEVLGAKYSTRIIGDQ